MRPVLPGDLVAAARALRPLPVPARPAAVAAMIAEAALADRFRKRLGRPHPRLGNGSLMAAASAWPQAAEPWLSDPDWLGCLAAVIAALRARAATHAAARKIRR